MKYNRSEYFKAAEREWFLDGTSKYTTRRCYGYDISIDGSFVIDSEKDVMRRKLRRVQTH